MFTSDNACALPTTLPRSPCLPRPNNANSAANSRPQPGSPQLSVPAHLQQTWLQGQPPWCPVPQSNPTVICLHLQCLRLPRLSIFLDWHMSLLVMLTSILPPAFCMVLSGVPTLATKALWLELIPYLFNRLADTFEWVLKHRIPDLMHYLDDYFTVGSVYSPACTRNDKSIKCVSSEVGIPLAPNTLEGPATQ